MSRRRITDKDRQLLADFMGYMREGGEIGEALRRRSDVFDLETGAEINRATGRPFTKPRPKPKGKK